MPSRYRRPIHENGAIEFTFTDYIQKTLNWTIDYNQATRMFVLTCKQGHHMNVPQGLGNNAREILDGHLQVHRGHI